jgi:enoyl reductase-like protein
MHGLRLRRKRRERESRQLAEMLKQSKQLEELTRQARRDQNLNERIEKNLAESERGNKRNRLLEEMDDFNKKMPIAARTLMQFPKLPPISKRGENLIEEDRNRKMVFDQ